MYAFGHPLDGAGRRSLLLGDAYVYDVIDNPGAGQGTSYKLAAFGHTMGTLTSDAPNAVIGAVGAPPATIPVRVDARDADTGRRLSQRTDVADESAVGFPSGSSPLDLLLPLAVVQAATQIYDGAPAAESGRMCLSLRLKESPRPLRFCNRYVGSGAPGGAGQQPPALALAASVDVSQLLGLLDGVQFATLHVTGVHVALVAERGLRQAQIISACAPRRVRAGSRVRVSLLVRLYRSVLRRISLRVRIPAGARGRLVARLGAPSPADPSAAAGGLTILLQTAISGSSTAPGSSGPPNPGSLGALRRAVAAIPPYDGLTLSFPGRRARRVLRDPNLLITGSAELAFRVVR